MHPMLTPKFLNQIENQTFSVTFIYIIHKLTVSSLQLNCLRNMKELTNLCKSYMSKYSKVQKRKYTLQDEDI